MPLCGRIAAGMLTEAFCDTSRTVDIPVSMLSAVQTLRALEVEGESMIDAGIHDGDTVLIERAETADSGAIVVAF